MPKNIAFLNMNLYSHSSRCPSSYFLPVSLRWQLETWVLEEMLCFDTIMLIYSKSNRDNGQSFLTMGWDVLHPRAHLPQAPTSSPTATPPSCRPCACLSIYRNHQRTPCRCIAVVS